MKQLNLLLPGLLKAFTLLLTLSIFVSCSPEEEVRPENVEVTFQIDLLKIAAIDIKEAEGEHLEIYGSIGSKMIRGNITETNPLWSQVKEQAVAVGYSDTPLIASVTYTVLETDIANSNLIVEADLFDYDGSGNNAPEDLGKESISTPLANITTSAEYQIVLNDSAGQSVKVTYSITRL